MPEHVPNPEEFSALLGQELYGVWRELCAVIEAEYDMEKVWAKGGRAWTYELKYRRGGRTLCALEVREGLFGVLIVLGKAERERFEADPGRFSEEVRKIYAETWTYHNGKWLLLAPADPSLFGDIRELLHLKRRPKRKAPVG